MRQLSVRAFASFALVAGLAAVPSDAQTNRCVVSRDQIIAERASGVSDQAIADKYAGCVAADQPQPAEPVPQTPNPNDPNLPPSIQIVDTGSTFWEAIDSCGYHPQRKELACSVEVRQRFGYGGVPALQPAGSYEYVLFCVDYGAGLVPVNVNGFHIHDEAFGVQPNWYFAAVVSADELLFQQPLVGQTLKARAILSWGIPPGLNCNFVPVWGNQADFRIRLDP